MEYIVLTHVSGVWSRWLTSQWFRIVNNDGLMSAQWCQSNGCLVTAQTRTLYSGWKGKCRNCIFCVHWLLRNIPPVELRRPEMFSSFNCITLLSRHVVQDKQWPNIFTWTFNKMVAFLEFPWPNGSPGVRTLHLLFTKTWTVNTKKTSFVELFWNYQTLLVWQSPKRRLCTLKDANPPLACLHNYPQRIFAHNRNSSAKS